jgi:hypothetical protein
MGYENPVSIRLLFATGDGDEVIRCYLMVMLLLAMRLVVAILSPRSSVQEEVNYVISRAIFEISFARCGISHLSVPKLHMSRGLNF